MRIAFHGAAQGVTGSCHLLEACGRRLLLDCGLFQGSRDLREENAEPFPFDPAGIDFVLLSHAHLDHCGRLPLLVERGFRGEILATGATFDLAQLVLDDTARLQEEEAARARRHARRGERHFREDAEPLYGSEAVEACCARFGRALAYGETASLAPGLTVTAQDAGHILGSASFVIEAREDGRTRRLAFSGDLGSRYHPIVRDPAVCPEVDAAVMETTYGGRTHRSMVETVREFEAAILETWEAGGNLVVPTFALERAQELLYCLREGLEAGRLPAGLKVFLDSPMAGTAVEVFRQHPECFDPMALEVVRSRDPFAFPGLAFARDRAESKAINEVRRGALVLAGSGMCTGGRVLHHLEQLLPRPECAVVFVGFAAQGTPARSLIDGARSLRLFGQDVPVRARIHTIGGFSGHAGHDGLLRWHKGAGASARIFLVHGDPGALEAMRADLAGQGRPVCVPAPGQGFDL